MVCKCFENDNGRERVGYVSVAVMQDFGLLCNEMQLCEPATMFAMHLTFARIMRGLAAAAAKGGATDAAFEKMLSELIAGIRDRDEESEAMVSAIGMTRQ